MPPKYDELCGAADIGDDASSLPPGIVAVLIGGKSKFGLLDIEVCAPFCVGGSVGSKGAGRL